MRLNTVPARQGVVWVRAGFGVFARRPFAFSALFVSVMFVILTVKLLPALMLVVLPLMPLVPLGFMIATRVVLGGGFPTPRVFVEPLRAERPRLIALMWLALIYAVATFAIMWIGDLVDGGMPVVEIDAASPAASAPDAAPVAAADAGALLGLMLRFGLAALLSIPFWHAPALVYWEGHSCAKALFSSTLACWRNRGAFVVYGLVWIGLMIAFGVLVSLILALFGVPQWLMNASLPMALIMATIYYASLYFTFADCFSPGEPELPMA